MWETARRVGVLVATGHILYREQEITSRPEKLAICRTSMLIRVERVTKQPTSSVFFYYEVEHVIENTNPETDQGSGVQDTEIEDSDERV